MNTDISMGELYMDSNYMYRLLVIWSPGESDTGVVMFLITLNPRTKSYVSCLFGCNTGILYCIVLFPQRQRYRYDCDKEAPNRPSYAIYYYAPPPPQRYRYDCNMEAPNRPSDDHMPSTITPPPPSVIDMIVIWKLQIDHHAVYYILHVHIFIK